MKASRRTLLFHVLAGFFVTNALLAEFLGVKIFSLERTLGFAPLHWPLWQGYTLQLDLTAGVVLWPVVFVLTDLVNEYYGRRGVRLLTYTAAALIVYSFIMVYAAIELVPAEFWITGTDPQTGQTYSRPLAYRTTFGQGLWIIVGSLIAFMIGQLADVTVFHRIRRVTGKGRLWLRATGSTLVGQLIDSFVVLYVAFGIGASWPMERVLAVGLNNYLYKFLVAWALVPALYLIHWLMDAYLGKELAEEMQEEAAANS